MSAVVACVGFGEEKGRLKMDRKQIVSILMDAEKSGGGKSRKIISYEDLLKLYNYEQKWVDFNYEILKLKAFFYVFIIVFLLLAGPLTLFALSIKKLDKKKLYYWLNLYTSREYELICKRRVGSKIQNQILRYVLNGKDERHYALLCYGIFNQDRALRKHCMLRLSRVLKVISSPPSEPIPLFSRAQLQTLCTFAMQIENSDAYRTYMIEIIRYFSRTHYQPSVMYLTEMVKLKPKSDAQKRVQGVARQFLDNYRPKIRKMD